MALFILYHGREKAVRVTGSNATRLAEFAQRNPGWHTFRQDRATRNAIAVCQRAGCIAVNGNQFIFTYPKGES